MNDRGNFAKKTELLLVTANEQSMQQIYPEPGSESIKHS